MDSSQNIRILTYGTFDLFHIGHLNLLIRAKSLGVSLAVGVSTDEFNEKKGKKSVFSYEERANIVGSIRYVDEVFPEASWDQKKTDIAAKKIDIFVMGDDWRGKFDYLEGNCKVVYLKRTDGISSSQLKRNLIGFDLDSIEKLKTSMDALNQIAKLLT